MQTDLARQVKDQLSIAEVVKHYGYAPNRAGFLLCPMHREDTPSLKIYPESNSYYCFGCGCGGDVISFVMQLFHLDFKGAVSRLAEDFRLNLPLGRRANPLQMQKRRHERWAQNRELEARRAEYRAKCKEALEIRSMAKPAAEAPQESPAWGQYAAALGRLDYLDNYYFESAHWR